MTGQAKWQHQHISKSNSLLQNAKRKATTWLRISLAGTIPKRNKNTHPCKNSYTNVRSNVIHNSGNNLSVHRLMNG